ncbi:helix-turn-helix domain-containing protein [Streptomyces sp. HPF1205]|uniref:helix-turn-helix domain-containing protein n=1 Tax=Streptomyces sp. HPF1205 TaxID=2873262 RepID=UPI001CEC4172|nr:helix-turn-helix domain-containing protein [Streptomyces sp. HPF1205]
MPDPLRAAAERVGLTVLEAPEAAYLPRLSQVISDLRHEHEAADARQMRLLLERARSLSSANSLSEGICQWLAEAVRGHAALITPAEADRPVLPDGIAIPSHMFEALVSGSPRSAALSEAGWSVRLYAMGATTPHPVLAVTRRGTWDEHCLTAVTHTQVVLAWWLSLASVSTEAMTMVRSSLMQMVMAGQIPAAQRAAAPLKISPAVMHAEKIYVYLVQGSAASRTLLIEACTTQLGNRALVAPCPVDARQVVVVTGEEDGLGQTLTAIAQRYSGTYVGKSQLVALHAAAEGHVQATRALAAAANAAGRTAVFTPDASVISLLARDKAHRWAAAVLTPLESWEADRRDRDHWLATIQAWMALGTTGAACLSGLHRNTVERRVTAIGAMLDMDITQLIDRLKLDLALRIMDLHGGEAPPEGPVPTWEELLATPELFRWAEEYLAPLKEELRETLEAWIDVNQSASLAAGRLGIGQKTVRARLRRASATLQQPLIPHSAGAGRRDSVNGFTGAHDVTLALMITRLPRPQEATAA